MARKKHIVPQKYKLEAYDKDNDIYVLILTNDDLDLLQKLGLNLWNSFNLTATLNNEPIDWLMISTERDEKPVCYLDVTWKNYSTGAKTKC